MSMPNIPDITPKVEIDIEDTVSMLLSSIALEEIGLSHIINAEAEKVQFVLGTLHKSSEKQQFKARNINDILMVNRSVDKTLRGVLKNQMLLQMKLEDTLELYDKLLSNNDGISCMPQSFDDSEEC